MTLGSNEHYEVIAMFEKEFADKPLQKKDKSGWSKGGIYEDFMTNELFLAYRRGVSFGKVLQ